MIVTRERLHELVDQLSPDQLANAARALEAVRQSESPRDRALVNAPIDDEPETPEEAAAVAEAWEDVRAGRVITDADLHRELGIPPNDDRS